jgi:ABC-type sulfate/molybdate transport systems ATPase subunit
MIALPSACVDRVRNRFARHGRRSGRAPTRPKARPETDMLQDQVRRRIEEVLGSVGLAEYIDRMPSELSGGQRRRVAIARAIAAKPSLLLFDDPTFGLDPITATTVDDEIVKLRDLEHVTSVVVTHQIRDAFYVATHEAVRSNSRVHIVDADETRARRVGFMVLNANRESAHGTVCGNRLINAAAYEETASLPHCGASLHQQRRETVQVERLVHHLVGAKRERALRHFGRAERRHHDHGARG